MASLGKYADAIQHYDKVIEAEPENKQVIYSKGKALASFGKYADAI